VTAYHLLFGKVVPLRYFVPLLYAIEKVVKDSFIFSICLVYYRGQSMYARDLLSHWQTANSQHILLRPPGCW
jgi:hypothetical protein